MVFYYRNTGEVINNKQEKEMKKLFKVPVTATYEVHSFIEVECHTKDEAEYLAMDKFVEIQYDLSGFDGYECIECLSGNAIQIDIPANTVSV